MEFEGLQAIWSNQEDHDLYTIDRDALYEQIKEKSASVNHKLNTYEQLMLIGNLLIGIVLFVDAVRGNGQAYEYALPTMYILFSIGTAVLRRTRQKEEIKFELTMMGELNKAIWQINYLIKRGRSMMLWYMLPLMLVLTVTLLLNSKPLWALGTMLVAVPLSYLGGRWEINKWYMPKKVELELLREELLG